MLPPDHPDAPKYWAYETGGELRAVVRLYLKGGVLIPSQVQLMKAYVWQWVSSPVWKGGGMVECLRLRVATIETQHDLAEAIAHAEALGMDPL
jgi:hypothetical protein